MQYIIDVLDFIVSTATGAWTFLTGIIENTIMLTNYLTSASLMVFNTLSSLPQWLQAFGQGTIVICVLYVIIGRQTGGAR